MRDLAGAMGKMYGGAESESSMGGAGANCVQVKAEGLAMDGGEEGGGSVAPGVGDMVEFTATGKVTAVDGGVATITIDSVNGAPVEGAAMAAEGEDEGGEDPRFSNDGAAGNALRARAESEDDAVDW